MAYKRHKSEISLSKPEKVSLMAEYIDYYERLINEQGLDVLNVKIPREVFADILDNIGCILILLKERLGTMQHGSCN